MWKFETAFLKHRHGIFVSHLQVCTNPYEGYYRSFIRMGILHSPTFSVLKQRSRALAKDNHCSQQERSYMAVPYDKRL
jgi:hypothetical protein